MVTLALEEVYAQLLRTDQVHTQIGLGITSPPVHWTIWQTKLHRMGYTPMTKARLGLLEPGSLDYMVKLAYTAC